MTDQHRPPNRGSEPLSPAEVRSFAAAFERIAAGVGSAVLGKPRVVRLALTALLARVTC